MTDKAKFFFAIVLFLFLISRLYKIDKIPRSVYWDEASIGYNAYSILKTGRDEWGQFLPLHFRAFGEFKLPVYIYSVTPFIYSFGLNELSVRLPSVFYSLGSLVLIYLLAKKMFKEEKIALLSSFLFAILPWDFIFSRTGYEASAGLFFYLLFLLLWFVFEKSLFSVKEALDGAVKELLMILLFLVFSLYSYNSFRIISPLTLAFLFLTALIKKNSNLTRKLILIFFSLVILAISFFPIYRVLKFDSGASRLRALFLQGSSHDRLISFSNNYLSHFSLDFLFLKGDQNLRSQMPGFGEIYPLSLPFLIIGLLRLIRKRDSKSLFLIFLFLIAPIPASLTKESPHSLRSILFAFLMPLIISFGINDFVNFLGKYRKIGKYKKVALTFVCLSYLIISSIYFMRFVKTYGTLSAPDWQDEYKELFYNDKSLVDKAEKVVISDTYGQPYIFALFYNQYDPQKFWQTVVYNPPGLWGLSTVYSFDKFIFKKPGLVDLREGSLVFSDKKIISQEKNLVGKILVDNRIAFFVYQFIKNKL